MVWVQRTCSWEVLLLSRRGDPAFYFTLLGKKAHGWAVDGRGVKLFTCEQIPLPAPPPSTYCCILPTLHLTCAYSPVDLRSFIAA